MATKYYFTSENTQKHFIDAAYKADKVTYSFDFSQWAEENGTLTTATWTVMQGNAAVSSAALNSNVATANILFSETGKNLIKLQVTDGTRIQVIYLDVVVKDIYPLNDDYGIGL